MIVLTSISLPLVIVVCAYFLIWVKITCMRNVLGHAIHQRNSKLSVTLAIVTIVSLIAWVPFMTCSAFLDFCYLTFPPYFLNMLKVLHYGNSFVNFIIYSLRMPDFRTGMRAQVSTFSICHAVHVTENVVRRNDIDLQNQIVEANVLHYGNSFVNFIIYSLRMPDFRAGMRAQVFKFSICHAVHV
ncbi:uncharacterized protein LOC114574377 [Exaiptasia diaphana]|uniref:G-protein coupled receptors family 1 profile domain-containing protein n=1 Tax=Exaiptasia diaphana TaxID=2652724 RepID=A0A913YBC3_EXADI|nr:uncharacterized protein LOC114574377 [Exaiptasia diaphana]